MIGGTEVCTLVLVRIPYLHCRSSKGDHMKLIEFLNKKHKANESQEKMTVTSGKDVCRRIGHSDEADGENQENAYIHDRFALDAGYANYIRETVPKLLGQRIIFKNYGMKRLNI